MKKWLIHQPPEEAAKQIRSGSDLSMLCAQVLASRGMHNVQEAAAFLQCDGLADPFLTADMETAADYINQALDNGSRICIYLLSEGFQDVRLTFQSPRYTRTSDNGTFYF